ncbi:hypothetical protein QYF36_000206 [Acer negundo]|nr:hypothetical protein QYF36_000206 [Acer negundo]
MIRRRYLGNIWFAREFEDEELPFNIDVGNISSLYLLKHPYPRCGGRLDLGVGGGFGVLDKEDGKWGSTLFDSYRPLLKGVEIELAEQLSIYSTWWEAGLMCKVVDMAEKQMIRDLDFGVVERDEGSNPCFCFSEIGVIGFRFLFLFN